MHLQYPFDKSGVYEERYTRRRGLLGLSDWHVQDRFPELRGADDEKILALLKWRLRLAR